jgi:hypothetical protein
MLVGRVEFNSGTKRAIKWFGIEPRLQDISAPSNSSSPLNKPVVSVAVDPTQRGYGFASLALSVSHHGETR